MKQNRAFQHMNFDYRTTIRAFEMKALSQYPMDNESPGERMFVPLENASDGGKNGKRNRRTFQKKEQVTQRD